MTKQLSERVTRLVTTKKSQPGNRGVSWKIETMLLPAQKVADLVKLIHKQLTKRRIAIYNSHNSCSFLFLLNLDL